MRQDKHGQFVLTERDICDLYMGDPDRDVLGCLVEQPIKFDPDLELERIPELIEYCVQDCTTQQFDAQNQQNWFMPEQYKQLDIAQWLLDQCETDAERQRVGQELMLYLERGMFPLLQYLKYLVDTMRVNNIVWGVGRGSSVASYVLYLLGVHRVNSMYYDLDINEFLR